MMKVILEMLAYHLALTTSTFPLSKSFPVLHYPGWSAAQHSNSNRTVSSLEGSEPAIVIPVG